MGAEEIDKGLPVALLGAVHKAWLRLRHSRNWTRGCGQGNQVCVPPNLRVSGQRSESVGSAYKSVYRGVPVPAPGISLYRTSRGPVPAEHQASPVPIVRPASFRAGLHFSPPHGDRILVLALVNWHFLQSLTAEGFFDTVSVRNCHLRTSRSATGTIAIASASCVSFAAHEFKPGPVYLIQRRAGLILR